MKLLRFSALSLALLVSASACNKNDDECNITQGPASPGIAPGGCVIVDPCAPPCGAGVCTMDLRSIEATVQFPPNVLATVDSFVVTNPAGTPLPPVNGEPVYNHSANRLTIATDTWVQGHQGMQMAVQAKGYAANGTLLFDQAYTIGADCCHIYKAAGPDAIVIQ